MTVYDEYIKTKGDADESKDSGKKEDEGEDKA